MVGKKLIFLLMGVMIAVVLSSCQKDTKEITIGISQIVEHEALDSCREGFIAALAQNGFIEDENLKIIFENAQGEPSNAALIAQDFVDKKVDMIFAIATPSAQAAANAIDGTDIPLVFSAVTDPVAAGLVDSLDNTTGNITGTSDMAPMDKQFTLLKELVPTAQKIGIVYNTSEVNSQIQVDLAETIAAGIGLTIVARGVTTTTEIATALDALLPDVDALYIPTDNLIASSMALVTDKTLAAHVPVIGSEEGQVNDGALATEGIDYYKLGFQTGEMAAQILKGEKTPNQFAVETLQDTDLVINSATATALGITISDELKAKATIVGE